MPALFDLVRPDARVPSDESTTVIVCPILPTATFFRDRPILCGLANAAIVVSLIILIMFVLHAISSASKSLLPTACFPQGDLLEGLISPIGLLVSCVAGATFGMDNRLCMSERGILVPLSMIWQTGFNRSVLWQNLSTIKIQVRPQSATLILLQFRQGQELRIDLRKLSQRDFRCLLDAIESWGTACKSRPEAEEIVGAYNRCSKRIAVENNSADTGYTSLWSEELARYTMTPFVPLDPGHRVGANRFTVERHFGGGGFSAVYLARTPQNERVILKEVVVPEIKNAALAQKAEEQFVREASILQRLDHPQIVKVYDHFVEQGRNYMVLQHIDGRDLRTVLQGTNLNVAEVCSWMKQLAAIVSYMHALKPTVIHRDLSPDNILLRADGQIVLIDFGAANEYAGKATGTLIGKQAYMAPEQVRGELTPQSDVYGLGATMYFCLCGKDPRPISELHPVMVNDAIPVWLDELVAECTRIDVDSRIQSMQELEARLSNKTGGERR